MQILKNDETLVSMAVKLGIEPFRSKAVQAEASAKRRVLAELTQALADFGGWLTADYACWVQEGREIRERYRWTANKRTQRARAKYDALAGLRADRHVIRPIQVSQ